MRFGACAVFLFTVCFASLAYAGQAYRVAVPGDPAMDEWRDGFSISLMMDEKRCKAEFGKDWFRQCVAPAAGEYGSIVQGIRMTPSVDGEWRWESESVMRFQPQKHLVPGTAYTVSLENVPFPARFTLARTVTYVAQPQAAYIGKEKLWIDPSPKAAHAVSVPVRFVWPVKPGDIEQRIALAPGDARSGLAFSALRFVWNEDKDEVIVTAPVTSLPAENAIARLTLQGLPSFAVENGRRVIAADHGAKAKPIESSFSVTGKSRLMDVSSISIRKAYGDNLDKEYHLEVKTTLRVLPSDVLRELDVIQLPRKTEPGAGRDANWALMPAISAEDISRGEKLKLELLQPADEATDLVRLRVPAQAGRGLLTAMKTGLSSTSGLPLRQVRRFILRAPSLDAELNFLQPGNVLVLRGEKKLDLHTLGLTSLTWRAERVREPFLALMARDASFENPDAPFEVMSDAVEGRMDIAGTAPGASSFPVLDLAPLLGDGTEPRHGLMRLTLAGFNGAKQAAETTRLVLVTDMGLIVKTAADGSRAVFVQQLSSGKPVGTAEVRVLGANGLPVATAKTNEQGRADLPVVRGLAREKRPVAVVAVASGKDAAQDMAWLPLNDAARRVDYSSYAVGGRHSVADGLSASVFSQRGLYLPGETLHFGCIVRRFDWQSLPDSMPLEAVIISPTGAEVFRRAFTAGADGLAQFDWTSAEDDAAGAYRLDIRLAGRGDNAPVLGSASVRIEEFQPDTLALTAVFKPGKPKGWIRADSGAGSVTAQARLDNLYGEPARDHRIRAEFRARPGKLRFPGYEDYTFHDPVPFSGEPQTLPLPDVFTDAGGLASFALPLHTLRAGTMQGSILIEGFESVGGRAVTRQLDALFSPLDVVLGYKPEGEANNLNYVPHGAKASLHVLAVDNDLNPAQMDSAVLTLSGRRYVNSLIMDARGEYRYDATPVDTELSRLIVSLDGKGLRWPLPTGTPGDFLVTIKKADGALLAGIPFSVAGNQLAPPDQVSSMSLAKGDLRLRLDKERYEPGDTVKMRLSAPYSGTGLITVERETVVAHAWFTVKAGDSVQEIRLPAEFEGRGYVNVSFARALDSDAVYMKPYAYAVAPFTAGVTQRDMGLAFESPARVVPGGQVKILLRSRVPGRAVIFAVDEGVLQLTGFATPDPLRELLSDRALDVETLQAFDLLMPDHARLRGRIPGFGGGMGNPGGLFLNPFKRRGEPPFAFWREAVEVDEKGAELSFDVPEYLSGRIRLMAVGSAVPRNGVMAVGSAQSAVDVRGTLILKPLLPLAVTPGDTFEGALVVANTVEGSGAGAQVKVSMECGPELAWVDTQTSRTLTVDENGEASLRFRLRANDALGATRVRFSASFDKMDKNAPALRAQSLSVRPPSPRVRTEEHKALTASGDMLTGRDPYPYGAQGSLSVSGVSTLALRSLMARLGEYPYGCTEQLISRALPYAALLGTPELREQIVRSPNDAPGDMEKRSNQAINRAIDAIRRGFVSGEGVSMWPNGQADDFVTAYAADFLLTLRENGGAVPEGLTGNVLNVLESIAMRSPVTVSDGRIKLYGAWILLRDGRIMTQAVERIEQWYKENAKNWEQDIASVLMADCFAMLRLGRRAQGRLPAAVSPTGDAMLSHTVARALHATVILRDFKERRAEIQTGELLDRAFNTNATTVDMAMTARALLAMADASAHVSADMRLSCVEYGPGFTAAPAQAELLGKSLLTLEAPGCRRYHVELPQNNTVAWHAHAVTDGFDRIPLPAAAKGLTLQRRYLDGKGQAVSSAKLGEVLTVELVARAEKGVIPNVVLVDLLPGGFEPVLEKKAPATPVPGLIRYERREDRGIFFVNLTTEPRTFTYRVRAATQGRFTLPAAAAAAMYEPESGARTAGGSITVE
jgi:uncharacterized protein YfaS (alpha-2-macroglobulin family)